MVTNDVSVKSTTWPMPKFRFEVDLETELTGVVFHEVSRMDQKKM